MAGSLQVGILLVLLGLFSESNAVLDFTCVTKPRIDIAQENGSIASFFVSEDLRAAGEIQSASVSLTFSRVKGAWNEGYILGTADQFRFASESGVRVTGAFLRMGNAGAEMVGAFSCEYNGRSVTKVIKMSLQADFVPVHVSQTKNEGDIVRLTVTAVNPNRTDTRWRKPPRRNVDSHYSNSLSFDIFQAMKYYHNGFYECHFVDERHFGNQAFTWLIVRGCGKNRWRTRYGCTEVCRVCFNGGVCDDKSGDCICPPGFSGVYCEKVLGPNRFGQRGHLRCDGPGLGDVPTCKGKLFCLPKPYGCSCAAGYKGIDCNQTCAAGSYGAYCSQTCHCMDGATCNGTTGVCPGPCAPGFMGINCQEECLPWDGTASCDTTCTDTLDSGRIPENLQVRASDSSHTYRTVLSWDPVSCSNGAQIVNYVYQVFKENSRLPLRPGFERVEGTTLQVDNLLPCLRYTFKVAAETSKGIGPFGFKRNFNTWAKDPDPVEGLTIDNVDNDFIGLSWNAFGANQGYPYNATDYRVTYKLVNLEQCRVVYSHLVDLISGNTTRVTLSGTKAYSTYRVSVRPNNVVGLCMEVHIEATTLETKPRVAPGFKDSFATSDSITLSWSPIPCGSRGGNITGYSTRLLHSREVINAINVTTELVTFGELLPCSNYTLEVRAFTNAGTGKALIVNETTNIAVPEAVRTITVVPTNRDKINVKWTASGSRQNPCSASSYQVTFELVNLEQCEVQNSSVVTNFIEVLNNDTVIIERLANFSTYKLNVMPKNEAGFGLVNFHLFETEENVPADAPTFTGVNASHQSITFSWNPIPCGRRGGNITHYHYRLSKRGEVLRRNDTTEQSVTFLDLSPCTSYVFKVRAHTRVGPGPWEETQEDPVAVDRIESLILKPSSNTIRASLTTSGQRGNPCQYHVFYELINMEQCTPLRDSAPKHAGTVNDSTIVIHSLHPYSTYRVHVGLSGNTNVDFQKTGEITTDQGVPLTAPEINLSVLSYGATFSWRPIPCGKRGGNIMGYTYELRKASGSLLKAGNTTAQSVTFDGLSQGMPYSFGVRAYTRAGPGPWMTVHMELAKVKHKPSPHGGSSAGLIIGVIICLPIIVAVALLTAVFVRRHGKRKEQRKETVKNVAADGTQAMYATIAEDKDLELQNVPSTSAFEPWADSSTEVSTDQQRTSSNNPFLSTKPCITKTLIVPGNARPFGAASDTSKPGSSQAAQTVMEPKPHAKSTKPQLKAAGKNKLVFSQTGPVAMAYLAQYIKSRKSGKVNGFQQDYETISREPLHPWTVAKMDHNRTKNRYINILPYDHSRVLLKKLEENPQSDYINASYINGYKHKSRYIACQGPTLASVNDMWHMVWQERVEKIVMLTNLVENGKGKCKQYWPESYGDYGKIFVRNVDEAKHDNFNFKTFHLSKDREPESQYRVVTQFHYTAWPDKKLPEPSSLLQFIRKFQTHTTSQHGPIVVHCSAGVGRTGTFIALDSMLEQAQAEGQVDVLSFVRDMSDQRFQMIQTLDQYKFIFDVLLESMLSETTAIPADRFRQDYTKLKKQDKKTGNNGIEDQFHMLESFTASLSSDQCVEGKPANMDENRFKHCIPRESSRPRLVTEGDKEGISATFLDGYRGKNAYIAMQAPFPNTVGDIWRMVFDYKSTLIVMLNSMDDDPRVAKYWPEKNVQCFGSLNVTLKCEDRRRDSMIIRQFDIVCSPQKRDEAQRVCHIQYIGWSPGKDVPDSASSLLEVLLEVRRWTDDHPNGPITVHCIDGAQYSGIFCALITLLDRLQKEKVVDVFQAVRKLRTIRPGFVKTLAQYQFCYKVIQTYLDSSSVYENLK